jgi:hypothetical protein
MTLQNSLNHRQSMIKNPLDTALEKHLDYLKLPYLKENCRPFGLPEPSGGG